MHVTFNGNPCSAIVSSFSPTNTSDEIDTTTFYNQLTRHIPKYNVLIIVEDMNALAGKDVNNKFCLRNLPKRNSKYI